MVRKEILNFFTTENIKLDTKSCINYGNRQITCSSCIQSCPNHAIQLVNQLPEIKHSKCINCGACVSACQVLAIDHIQKPYQEIYKQVEENKEASITCEQFEAYQKGIKIPCYRYLDIPLTLEYSDGKDSIKVYLGNCQKCSKADYLSVEEHLTSLHTELTKLNKLFEIKFVTGEFEEGPDPIINALSRRELFQMLSLKNIRKEILKREDDEKEKETKKSFSRKDRVLFKRRKIMKHIPRLDVIKTEERYVLPEQQFLNLHLADSCDGCLICTQICPTNALRWVDKDTQSQLVFSIEECIACKKCEACPQHAITFEEALISDYMNQEVKVFKSFQVKRCVDCGDSFRTYQETDICSFCMDRKKKESSRFFG